MSEEVERIAKYTIDAVLEVWGSFDVEADNLGEAYRKAGENPGKYADLKVWNDGAEAQLRTYSHITCLPGRKCCPRRILAAGVLLNMSNSQPTTGRKDTDDCIQ